MQLIKVELTYDNGEIYYLDTPEEIKKWNDRIVAVCIMQDIHDQRPKNMEKWKVK